MIDINNFDAIEIILASSKQIRSWSSGEVTKPETINYRTLKPEKDGLFCERIFGPTKDWECYCGKYKRVRYKGIVCERCGVEVTRSKVRRERMGHVDLAAPVSHIWFFKGVPSRIGYLLDIAPKELEKVLYFAASIVTWIDEEARAKDLDEAREGSQEGPQRLRGREAGAHPGAPGVARAPAQVPRDRQADEVHRRGPPLGRRARLDQAHLEGRPGEAREGPAQGVRPGHRRHRGLHRRRHRAHEQAWEKFQEMKVQEVIQDEALFRELKDRFGSPFGWGEYFRGGMGAESVRDLLEQVDLDAEANELEETIKTSKGQKQNKAIKRLKVVSAFRNSKNRPEWMVLEAVPVIPPELRPMVQLDGGRFATSRPERPLPPRHQPQQPPEAAARPRARPRSSSTTRSACSRRPSTRCSTTAAAAGPSPARATARSSRSSDMLKGKQGRFRQNLLGKRVDYSGRSVIVAGPNLKLHQCGLPKLMALELFKPFIMARLVERKAVQNIKAAKKMVESMIPEVWDVLEEVIHEHPVLLNRAPTLHRLGIQAFEPVLVEGKAIQIHPLVCHAFNADFDGDQMAVHVPLSAEAQAEARVLMLSANNILSPAHGSPLATPTQDMVLGVYYLTYGPERGRAGEDRPEQGQAAAARVPHRAGGGALLRQQQRRPARPRDVPARGRRPHLHDGRPHPVQRQDRARARRDARRRASSPASTSSSTRRSPSGTSGRLVDDAGRTATARPRSRWCSTPSRTSASTTRARRASRSRRTTSSRRRTRSRSSSATRARSAQIQDQYDQGLITLEERHEKVVDKWNQATDEVAEAMEAEPQPS